MFKPSYGLREWQHSRRCSQWFVAWWECLRQKRPVTLLVVPIEVQPELETTDEPR